MGLERPYPNLMKFDAGHESMIMVNSPSVSNSTDTRACDGSDAL